MHIRVSSFTFFSFCRYFSPTTPFLPARLPARFTTPISSTPSSSRFSFSITPSSFRVDVYFDDAIFFII